jgi:hypothetical protein
VLTEQIYKRPNVGTLRVMGDIAPGEQFKIEDIAFAEFETLDGVLYAPLTKTHAVMILTTPRRAVEICETPIEEIEMVREMLGLE